MKTSRIDYELSRLNSVLQEKIKGLIEEKKQSDERFRRAVENDDNDVFQDYGETRYITTVFNALLDELSK